MLDDIMMHNEVTLRPANVADTSRLAHLWATIFADKFGPILGRNTVPVLHDWFSFSQRHIQTTTMAECKGTTVGFMVLETPTSPPPDDGRWLWHALQRHNGILGALRGFCLLLLIDNEHQLGDDEVYIEMLGVDPHWQGQGVAQQLLHHAETIAQQHRVRELTLNVLSGNTPALSLYQKMNFTIRSENRNRVLKWLTGHNGVYEMVKQIEPAYSSR